MTVKELIEQLQNMPPETRVQMEGLEWAHDIDDVSLWEIGKTFRCVHICPDNSKEPIVYLRIK